MKVSIHQPSYFPWLGLLDKINSSDVFVLLDNVQLNNNAYQHRNIFLDNQNTTHLLTMPINKKNFLNTRIKDIKLSNNIWQKKHNKFLYFNYKKHPYFDEVYDLVKFIYEKDYIYLIDVLIDIMTLSLKMFKIDTKMILASDLPLNNELKKEDLVIDILKNCKADSYLSGQGAKSYQNKDNFVKHNIDLIYQEFKHPIYKQYKNEEFISSLSCLDIVFNLGLENTNKILY